MPTNWRVYKNQTVASRLDRTELPGFFRKTVVAGPNEAALVVRDGEPCELLTEASFQAADAFDQLNSMFGVGADISVFFVDLSPFELSIFLGQSTSTAVTASDQTSFTADSSVREARDVSLQTSEQSVQTKSGGPVGFVRRLLGLPRKTIDAAAATKIGWQTEIQGVTGVSASVKSQLDVSRLHVVALSADREVIQVACQIRLRVDLKSLRNLIALLRGKRALATWDVESLLRDEWFAKVLVPEISRYQSSELRGNRDLLVDLETQTREALTETLNSCGLILETLSLNWGLTESEKAQIARKRAEREEEAGEFAKARSLAQMARELEIDKTRIANLQELKIAQSRGDQELRNLLLAGDLNRDVMVKNNQVDFALVDARIRNITLDVEKKESVARLEKRRAEEELRLDVEDRTFRQKHAARLAELDASDKEMSSMVKMQIEMATQKHDRTMAVRRHEADAEFRKMQADIEDRYQQRKLKLDESLSRMGMMERLVSQGLSAGQADASVLRTMLEQSTEQEYATATDGMVKAREEAAAAGNNLETFRTAQADERDHQVNMTALSAQMMAAAKQGPAPIIMPGGGPSGAASAGQPIIINNPSAVPQSISPTTPQPTSGTCPSCGQGIQAAWKLCPYCGGPLKLASPQCPGCGSEVQPGWKACPHCGKLLFAERAS